MKFLNYLWPCWPHRIQISEVLLYMDTKTRPIGLPLLCKPTWRNESTIVLHGIQTAFCTFHLSEHLYVLVLRRNFPEPEATPTLPHPILGDNIFVRNYLAIILRQEVPGWKIIQVRNEKLNPEKQTRNIMYILVWLLIKGPCVCIELFIYILILRFVISVILP